MRSEAKTHEETLWTAIAHGGILVNAIPAFLGIGIMIALGIWVFKGRTSPYIGYQALQAGIFQAAILFVFMITPIPAVAFLLLIAGMAYGLYAAHECHIGHDPKYFLIGKLIPSSHTRE
ncbi:MAG: hypothetical protein V3U26_02740 [Dehalococcoidia bacterium]